MDLALSRESTGRVKEIGPYLFFVILTDFMFQNISTIAAHVVINCITWYLDKRKCNKML